MLTYKPDWDEAVTRWEHFWHGELWKRPVLMGGATRNPGQAVDPYSERYYRACTGHHDEQLALNEAYFENTRFLGESMPCFSPDFGPDQCAAFFGTDFHFSEESKHTNWVDPVIDDWDAALPLVFHESNPVYQRFLAYTRKVADHARGRYLVSCIDMHSNADILSALRGPQRFCMDFYDYPEAVGQAMRDVRRAYRPMIDAVRAAGNMGAPNGCVQYGVWHPRSYQVVQSDVICMLSPDHFREYILPALEEEVACHESSYFHLDGPGALRHLDDILALDIHILQWQSGDGVKPSWQWLDVLKAAQAAGKAVEVFGAGLTPDVVKGLHRELNPARVIYYPWIETEKEFDELAKWLEAHC